MRSIRILLDLRHPLAALALQPAAALVESLAVEADWLPLSAPPLKHPSVPQAGDDRGVRHRRHRARAIAREIETYAQAQGFVLREPYRDAEVQVANLAWLWMRERHRERLCDYLEALFRGYWSLELDASNAQRVAGLVDSLAGDGAAFLDWAKEQGPEEAAGLAAALREQGLFQVPAFVVEDEVFYGRQHLPMIRWILQGRVGPVPI